MSRCPGPSEQKAPRVKPSCLRVLLPLPFTKYLLKSGQMRAENAALCSARAFVRETAFSPHRKQVTSSFPSNQRLGWSLGSHVTACPSSTPPFESSDHDIDFRRHHKTHTTQQSLVLRKQHRSNCYHANDWPIAACKVPAAGPLASS